MSHFESKRRLLGQILEKPCVRSSGHIFSPIIITLGQNVCLDEISGDSKNGLCRVKNLVTESNLKKIEYVLEASFSVRYSWNLDIMFAWTKSRTNLKMGQVTSRGCDLNLCSLILCHIIQKAQVRDSRVTIARLLFFFFFFINICSNTILKMKIWLLPSSMNT